MKKKTNDYDPNIPTAKKRFKPSLDQLMAFSII